MCAVSLVLFWQGPDWPGTTYVDHDSFVLVIILLSLTLSAGIRGVYYYTWVTISN